MGFLVGVVIVALALGWVLGIAEISGTRDGGFATGTKTTWLLLVIFTGVVGLVAYVTVGKRRGSSPSAMSGIPNATGFEAASAPTLQVESSHTAEASADSKMCPDCAEEVRQSGPEVSILRSAV